MEYLHCCHLSQKHAFLFGMPHMVMSLPHSHFDSEVTPSITFDLLCLFTTMIQQVGCFSYPLYLLTTTFQITRFLCLQTITNNGWLYTLLQRPQPMGGVDPDAMGISWYMSLPITIPGERCDSVRALSPLPHRSVGRQGEAPMQCGISLDSARQNHWGGDGIQADHSVGPPTPSTPPLLGWGSEDTHPTYQHRQ